MTDVPVSTTDSSVFPSAIDALRDECWQASPAELGHSLLGAARQLRRELRGQVRGLPDLSRAGALDPESILVWEILPEVARRLIEREGVELLMTPQERRAVPCDHLTDLELRGWVADCLRPSRFVRAAKLLRADPDRFPLGPDALFVSEVFGVPVERGHMAELATARLIESGPDAGKAMEDPMSTRIRVISALAGRSGAETSWSPELHDEITLMLGEPRPAPANDGHPADRDGASPAIG